MPPLVMPCAARKLSSVRTNMSKIALPIPRTSYFASVMRQSCCGDCDGAENPLQVGFGRGAAAYHDQPCASKRRGIHAFMIRSFLTLSVGTLGSPLFGFPRG